MSLALDLLSRSIGAMLPPPDPEPQEPEPADLPSRRKRLFLERLDQALTATSDIPALMSSSQLFLTVLSRIDPTRLEAARVWLLRTLDEIEAELGPDSPAALADAGPAE